MKEKLHYFWYSFPMQLTILHLRSNGVLLLFWLIMVLFASGKSGKLFGLQYLFTAPEYLGTVNPISFAFIGLAFGAFVMVWHMSTYMLGAFRFPFLASLSRPFTKFIINNFTVPLIGFVSITTSIIYVQRTIESKSWMEVSSLVLGWFLGIFFIVMLIGLYLLITNKDYRTYVRHLKENPQAIPLNVGKAELAYQKYESLEWRVETYLSESFKPRLVRRVEHYPASILQKVYSQNHKNGLFLLISGIFLMITLGLLSDNAYFKIPAGASLILLFSVLMSLTSAISFWFRKWRIPVFVLILFVMNDVSKHDKLQHINEVYGINYNNAPLPYDSERVDYLEDSSKLDRDRQKTLEVLANWKQKQGNDKPLAVFLCASGGGQRAGVWAIEVMDSLNHISRNKLLDMSVMMSGASGGVLGMAYYRSVFQQKWLSASKFPYKKQFSRDMLNSLSFALVSNDIFPNLATFKYGNKTYFRDRGSAFESQFNNNTQGLLDRPLCSFYEAESKAQIPLLFITPTIINDGKRLIISPLDVSYMTEAPFDRHQTPMPQDGIEFRDFFKSVDADSLRFLSALRMNCTFPYILPNVLLPTVPVMEVMDAGFGDNFGIAVAHRFISNFKSWLKENTSGIVIIEISAVETKLEQSSSHNKGIFESLVSPLGFASTILLRQKYEQNNYIQSMIDYFGEDNLHVLRFRYEPEKPNQRASMSFHLTQNEKTDIHRSLNTPDNIKSFERFKLMVGSK